MGAIDLGAASTWLLAFSVVLYLGLDGGGYDLVVRNQLGLVVWWGLLLCGVLGLLANRPRGRLTWFSLGAFGCFLLWTGVAVTSSVSTERSLAELSRVACYLGVFALGLSIHRDRERAIRHTMSAVAAAITVVAAVAVLARLRPDTFAASQQTASLLPYIRARLSWPLNYWNGLAALMVLGLPLLLGLACSAQRLLVRAAAAGAAPLMVLCGYLTFSRGGAIEAGVALLVFLLLVRDHLFKVLTGLAIAAGSAVLIAGAVHRRAIWDGLTNAAAQREGRQLLVVVVLVCLGTALVQAGIALFERHGRSPRWLRPNPRATWMALLGIAVGLLVAAAATGWLSRQWQTFKRPVASGLKVRGPARFGVASGNGRYQLWQVAVDSAEQRLGTGWGPGTYALLWPPRAPFYSPVQNAHSLYLETFAEEGIPGLVLLVAFLGAIVAGAIRAALRARHTARTQAAAVAAACVAFLVSAGLDWAWQLPVLPCAFLLLGAAALVPAAPRRWIRKETDDAQSAPAREVGLRATLLRRSGLAILAVGCLFVIGWPLAETSALRASQAAAGNGATLVSLRDAQTAARLEPDAATPQLQLALVLETRGEFTAALAPARRATADEPLNWSNWVVLSRLQAEAGHAVLSLRAYDRARSLNPKSPLVKL